MSGLFIALTGLIGIIPCFLYSAERNIKVKSGNKEGFLTILYIFICLNWGLAAISLKSELLGFITVVCVFSILRFTVECFGLGYAIGWRNEEEMLKNVVASLILMLAIIYLKFYNLDSNIYIKFFRKGF